MEHHTESVPFLFTTKDPLVTAGAAGNVGILDYLLETNPGAAFVGMGLDPVLDAMAENRQIDAIIYLLYSQEHVPVYTATEKLMEFLVSVGYTQFVEHLLKTKALIVRLPIAAIERLHS